MAHPHLTSKEIMIMKMTIMVLPCSFVTLYKCWWTLWMRLLHIMCAASNPMTSRWPSRMYLSSLFLSKVACILSSRSCGTMKRLLWFSIPCSGCNDLRSGVIHSVTGWSLSAGLIPNVRCSSSELVVSWKPSASLLQASRPGTDEHWSPWSYAFCAPE